MSLVDSSGRKIEQISQEERSPGSATRSRRRGTAAYFSVWSNRIFLWPRRSSHPTPIILRGYRKPLAMFDAPTGQVDADPRLHQPLAHYAMALAYAQQEDEVLESAT